MRCMFCFRCCLCVLFGRLKVDIACSHTVYILIRVSYSGQVNGTNQSYAHLCVCANIFVDMNRFLEYYLSCLCLMCSDTVN